MTKMKHLVFFLLLVFASNSIALDFRQYKDGFRSGWNSAFYEKGKATPGVPSVSPPPAKKGGDKRDDYERGYTNGYVKAQKRLLK
jgi:hypothetical protein